MGCVYQELRAVLSPEMVVVGSAGNPCSGWMMVVDTPD